MDGWSEAIVAKDQNCKMDGWSEAIVAKDQNCKMDRWSEAIVAKDQNCKMFHRTFDRFYNSSNRQLTIISLKFTNPCLSAMDTQSIFCDVGAEVLDSY
jgi:hypothetical protein